MGQRFKQSWPALVHLYPVEGRVRQVEPMMSKGQKANVNEH